MTWETPSDSHKIVKDFLHSRIMRSTFLFALVVVLLISLVGGYIPLPPTLERRRAGPLRALLSAVSQSGPSLPGDDDRSDSSAPVPFDLDFAEAMSKPLPEWYVTQKAERETLLRELQENRDRIIREFRSKYEVSDEEKLADLKKKNKWGFLEGRRSTGTDAGQEEDSLTTREKWELFWKEEEKSTGFYLPGFFEVFPELQLKWPNWAKRKGEAIECEKDEDCQFPQACCPHPLIPGDKFCCTGWTQRIMVPAYAKQTAATDRRTRDEAEDEDRAKEAERREKTGKRPWEADDE